MKSPSHIVNPGLSKPALQLRKAISMLASALLLVAGAGLVGASTSVAATVTGLTAGKFGSAQAIAVQRSPAFPTCSGTTMDPLTVSGYQDPYSDPTGPVALGDKYLMVLPNADTTDVANPWSLVLFDAVGNELRYSSVAASWVTSSDPNFTSAAAFSAAGQIYGEASTGFLYNAKSTSYGTFISPGGAIPASPYTYTPDATYNTCSSGQALGTSLSNLPVSDTPSGGTAGGGGGTGGGGGGGGSTTTYTMAGYYAPFSKKGVASVLKAGSTLPIKFNVYDQNGLVTDPTVISGLSLANVRCSDQSFIADYSSYLKSPGNSSLRWDSLSQTFIWNLKLPAALKSGCWSVTVTAGNASASGWFQAK